MPAKPVTGAERQHAPLRSTSQERQPYGSQHEDVPHKLQAVTMNYSTLTRSLTPIENITSSGSYNKSGYFQG